MRGLSRAALPFCTSMYVYVHHCAFLITLIMRVGILNKKKKEKNFLLKKYTIPFWRSSSCNHHRVWRRENNLIERQLCLMIICPSVSLIWGLNNSDLRWRDSQKWLSKNYSCKWWWEKFFGASLSLYRYDSEPII